MEQQAEHGIKTVAMTMAFFNGIKLTPATKMDVSFADLFHHYFLKKVTVNGKIGHFVRNHLVLDKRHAQEFVRTDNVKKR